jgi:hypothetical protein
MNTLLNASERARARRARGGAMVEFVVLNVVLVPLLLYAIFLMDAAYLKLDLQETVVAGVWDFSQRNSEPPADTGAVGPANNFNANNGMELQATAKALRIVYADHTSAFDDGGELGSAGYGNATRLRGNGNGDRNSPGGHMRHHTGFGAQYTFRFKPPPDNHEDDDEEEGTHSGDPLEGVGTELDTQFKCRIVTDMGWSLDPNMTAFGQSGYNAGGEARCSSIAFIYNYIIPEKFLQEFSETDKLTAMKRRRDATPEKAHEYQGQGGRTGNIVAEETAAISFNTWALRNGARQQFGNTTAYGGKQFFRYDPDDPNNTGRVDQADIGDRTTMGGEKDPKDNPFFRRVQYMYSQTGAFAGTYTAIAGSATSFVNKATVSNQILFSYALPILPGGPVPPRTAKLPGTPVDVGMPNISGVFMAARYVPGSPGEKRSSPRFGGMLPSGNDYQSTPYEGHNPNYQTAASARGEYYMGCRTAENPDCF